jgi:hypothetical protein
MVTRKVYWRSYKIEWIEIFRKKRIYTPDQLTTGEICFTYRKVRLNQYNT